MSSCAGHSNDHDPWVKYLVCVSTRTLVEMCAAVQHSICFIPLKIMLNI